MTRPRSRPLAPLAGLLGLSGALALVIAAVALISAGCKKDGAQSPESTAVPSDEPSEPVAAADEDEDEEEESPYLDASNFNAKIEQSVGEVVACYQKTAAKEADAPTGRVRTTVVVDGQGGVSKVMFDDQRSDLKHPALYACITEVLKGLKFNISLTGGDTPMPYTFDLRKGELLPE